MATPDGWLVCGSASANMILNGDFETNSAPSSTQFNLSNAAFTGMVADATAFGDSQEIDLTKTGDGWGINPQSGNWKLGLHTRLVGFYDAFSLTLSTPIVSGQSYQLKFFAAQYASSPPAAIQIGLSNSASIFGTLLTSGLATSSAAWSQFDFSFIAPTGANSVSRVAGDPHARPSRAARQS